jgi:hypothetical protein
MLRRAALPALPALLPLLALLALAALLLAPSGAQGEEEGAAGEQAVLDGLIRELRIEAEEIRGLSWKHDVPGAVIAPKDIPAAFDEELNALLSPEAQDLVTKVARRTGLLRADQDIWELQKAMMVGMVGGFYSPRAKKLYVVEGYSGDAARPVILHELVHALEDQHYDLDAVSMPLLKNLDRTFAVGCLVEGSAEHARVTYQARHKDITALFLEASRDPAAAQRQMQVLSRVPAWMILPMMMQYQTGPAFVAQALGAYQKQNGAEDKGSTVAYAQVMGRLWQDPPISSEQVLHPERWFGAKRDYPRAAVWAADLAETLGRGWEVVHEQQMGELDLALYLEHHLGGRKGLLNPTNMLYPVPAGERARTAAAGWDAGSMVFLEKPGAPMAMIQAWAFDTEKDAKEAADALLDALKQAHGEDWAAESWQAASPALGAPLASRTLSYTGTYGPGRMVQRGPQILIADGIPAARMDTVWRWLLQTRFLKDERDTWVD